MAPVVLQRPRRFTGQLSGYGKFRLLVFAIYLLPAQALSIVAVSALFKDLDFPLLLIGSLMPTLVLALFFGFRIFWARQAVAEGGARRIFLDWTKETEGDSPSLKAALRNVRAESLKRGVLLPFLGPALSEFSVTAQIRDFDAVILLSHDDLQSKDNPVESLRAFESLQTTDTSPLVTLKLFLCAFPGWPILKSILQSQLQKAAHQLLPRSAEEAKLPQEIAALLEQIDKSPQIQAALRSPDRCSELLEALFLSPNPERLAEQKNLIEDDARFERLKSLARELSYYSPRFRHGIWELAMAESLRSPAKDLRRWAETHKKLWSTEPGKNAQQFLSYCFLLYASQRPQLLPLRKQERAADVYREAYMFLRHLGECVCGSQRHQLQKPLLNSLEAFYPGGPSFLSEFGDESRGILHEAHLIESIAELRMAPDSLRERFVCAADHLYTDTANPNGDRWELIRSLGLLFEVSVDWELDPQSKKIVKKRA